MKLPPQQVNSFLQSPPNTCRGVLFYGPDAGLVKERVDQLARIIGNPKDLFATSLLSYEQIKLDPGRFSEELTALTFTGIRRLVMIDIAVQSIEKDVQSLIEAPPGKGFFIVHAQDLNVRSNLRVLFEKHDHLVAIPCYIDDTSSLKDVIGTMLQQAGLSYDRDAIMLLQTLLYGDRLLVRREVEKLILYMGNEKHVTSNHVCAAIENQGEISLDKLCIAICSHHSAAIPALVKQSLLDGVAPIVLLRSITRYFQRLYSVHQYMEDGLSEAQAISALKPPVFFKQVPEFKKHLGLWNMKRLERSLRSLLKAEQESKRTGMPAEILVGQMMQLLSLAKR